MIPVPSGVRVWLAVGHTDMPRRMNSLALQVQEGLKRDPHAGDLYVFRGTRSPDQNSLARRHWHVPTMAVTNCDDRSIRPFTSVRRAAPAGRNYGPAN